MLRFCRSRFWRWSLLVPVLAASLLPAISDARSAGTSRSAAARSALAALRADRYRGAEIVFGLPALVRSGTVITAGGPERPSRGGRVVLSSQSVVATVRSASWFFYQDLAPFQQYSHPGRVALVDIRTGRVTVSRRISWPPLLDGRLPAFLTSQSAYDSPRYQVLSRPYSGTGGAIVGHLSPREARATRDVDAAIDPSLGTVVARMLAAEHACAIRFSDTIPGGYYAFARTAQSRAALAYRFAQLAGLAPGFESLIYPTATSVLPTAFISRQIAAHGCRDVLLYMAGAGYATSGAVNIGMGLRRGGVRHQDVTLSTLRGLLSSHPSVHFELVLDAAHSSVFQGLASLRNVLLVATPTAPGGGSFTYLPEALVDGRLMPNQTNPLHLLQLTDRLAFGLDRVIGSPAEVAQIQSLSQAGKLPSAMAYLLARAFALGAPVDFAAGTGVGSPPQVTTNGFSAGPPPVAPPTTVPPIVSVVTASADSYATGNDVPLNVSAADGVLANDSDSAHYPLAVDELNGTGGTPPLHGTSRQGAAVTLNADGSFTYDPTGSPSLQALNENQTAVDSFTYRANDGHGGVGTATVTITVTGAHKPPVLAGIETGALQYDAGTAAVPITSTLIVTDPDATQLTGATVTIASGLVASEDRLALANQNGISGSYDATTGVLTLTGTSSLANYQAALRSVTFADPNGTSPTTGTRAISFQVNDGNSAHNLSNAVTRDVSVNPNPPPTASNVSASTGKHTAIDINVLSSASDPDGDTLTTASVDTTGTKGVVSINPNGTIHYDPNGQFQTLTQGQTATDTFTYKVSDGFHDSNSATVTVTINGSNDAPVLSNIETSTLQYDAGTLGVAVTSSLTVGSPDTTILAGASVSISSGFVSSEDQLQFTNQNGITGSYDPSTGVLTLSGTASVADYQAALRSVIYLDSNGTTPSTGARTISFQVDDGLASNNLSNVVSRSINVNPNSPPVAGNVSASTDKHTAIDINVLASDSDPDGDTISVVSVNTTGTLGTVSINSNGTIHYDPNGQFENLQEGQTASDTFTYKVTDGYHDSNSATVTVTINGVNDPPVLSNVETSTLQYDAGTPAVPVTSALTVSDPDDTNLAGATVSISSGFVSSEDSLQFVNQNGITGSYDSSTGVLTLTGSAPLADYQTALRSVTYGDSNGTNPTTGTRTISFQANDGHSANNLSNVPSRTISVNPNTPPVAGNVSASTDKHTAIDINVLSSDSDPDGDTIFLSSVDTTGTKGSVSINPNGTIHYDPNGQFQTLTQGQTATDTFTYTVSDGYFTATATVTVTITGVNDPPAISNVESSALSYRSQDPAVAITGTLTLSDDDDSTISSATVSITSGFNPGQDSLPFTNQNGITGSYDSATGVLTLSGNAAIADYQAALRSVAFFTSDPSTSPAARTVSFTATDSLGATSTAPAKRTIDVSEANQPPVAVNHSYTAVGNTPLGVGTSPTGPAATVSGSLLNGDSDPDSGDPITLTGNTNPAHGMVAVNPDGTFTYTPNAGFSGTDSFTYTITDSDDPANPQSATATVTITVGPVVWYVDNSKTAAGNGTAGSPFNTLAAANSAAGANSVIFLYQGNATYTGGVSMRSGEDLFGQPNGLTVDGYSLVPAGGSAPTITNSGGDGIDLAENADVEGVDVSGPSGNGIAASGVNDAMVGGTTGVAVSGAGGDGIHVSGGNGNLDFAAATVSGSTGHSVSVASRTGGTVSFGGDISDDATGISLSSNTGATISFSGKITASTATHTAFTATGGGSVAATGSGSTLTTTTATALNVSNTTIGSSGLTFQSISSNGANPGINLSGTGTSGGLTVKGMGSAGSGGTIQSSAGAGVNLSSTSSPSFTDMVITNNASDGINGSSVAGFTLASSTVSGNGTAANVSAENDDGLDFLGGLTGTVTISNSSITNSADSGLQVTDSSGSLNLTIAGSTFSGGGSGLSNNLDPLLGDGVEVLANGPTNATVSVTGSTFKNNEGYQFDLQPSTNDTTGSGTDSVTFNTNTLSNSTGAGNGGGVLIWGSGTSTTALNVESNNIQGAARDAIAVVGDTSAGISGTVNGNTVGTPSVSCSGSVQGSDIAATTRGASGATLAITNNNLYQYDNPAGISTINDEGSGTMNLTITGNTIADPVSGTVTCPTQAGPVGALWGLWLTSGGQTGDTNVTCANITGNSMTGSAPSDADGGIDDFEFDETGNGIFKLPGYTGGSNDSNAVVSFIQGQNTPSGGSAPSGDTFIQGTGSGGGVFFGATSCPTPS